MQNKVIYLYKERSDVTLTTYILDHSSVFLPDVKRPAVLICPGGAYMTCADTEGEPVVLAFNSMGYHAFVLRYSVYMKGEPGIPIPGARMEPREHCQFPNPMLDIGKAMEEIQNHAAEWKVNGEQIVLCGFSAGGHNCGMYSACWKEYGLPKPAAAILGYPLADYRLQSQEQMSEMSGIMSKMSSIAIMGKPEMSEAESTRISVIDHIDENTPPMFLWNTSEDEQALALNTLGIAQAMAKHHIPFELHVFENGPHGMSTANECSALVNAQIRPEIEEWLKLARIWIKKKFKIEFPEQMPF